MATGRTRQHEEESGGERDALSSIVFHVIDELGLVREMLEMMPVLTHMLMMVNEVDHAAPPAERDRLAEMAHKYFGRDVDAVIEQPHDMSAITELPDAIAAMARWRLKRVQAVLQWARGAEWSSLMEGDDE